MDNNEKTNVLHPVGLYHDPESGQYAGAIDPIQADAMIAQGWVLHTEGRDAAMSSQEDIDALKELDGEKRGSVTAPKSPKKEGK